MEIDSKEPAASNTKKEKTAGTAPSSKAPSPKPARAAKETPQLPQGSGLITNALFGGVDDSSKSDSRSTPNIIVHVPLRKSNQIVNFAQLAEEQYGFAALHPRLAAHKERLAQVAAAGAALERNDKGPKGISAGDSADEDLSLDVDRDSDMEGDVTMSGLGAGTNGAPSEASDGKKKRRRKVEEYDRDDPFVDDTEMAWQEQAAASKDGFFVYSGPLVPEGEKVQVERLVSPSGSSLFDVQAECFIVPTEPSSVVVVVAEEQPAGDPWLLTPMFPLLPQFLSPKIPAFPFVDRGLEVVLRAVPGAPRKPIRARSMESATAELHLLLMRVAVVVAVVTLGAVPAAAEAVPALAAENHLLVVPPP